MYNIRYILVLLILVLLFGSCQEPYYNDDLDSSEQIPCVDARITTFYDAHFVKLYYARSYNEETYEDISGANVRVNDDQGNTYSFTELYAGYYQIERGELMGQPGVSYTLIIDLPDGTVIKSYPQVMPDTIGIEKLAYPIITQEDITEDEDGEYYTETTEGYSYQITTRQPDDRKAYYRLKSDFYVHSTYNETGTSEVQVKTTGGDSVNIYTVNTTNTYQCYQYFTDDELPMIGVLNPGIPLSEEERTTQTQFLVKDYTYYTDDEFVEWVVMADVYCITEAAYQYYEALSEQLSAPDRIFDPIASQLSGNMYCSSDTNQTVLGLFDVAAKTRKYNGLYKYVSHGAESIQSRFYSDSSEYYNDCILSDTSYDSLYLETNPVDD